jgi:predicted lipoprotein with Yx(FWY)xxD motif
MRSWRLTGVAVLLGTAVAVVACSSSSSTKSSSTTIAPATTTAAPSTSAASPTTSAASPTTSAASPSTSAAATTSAAALGVATNAKLGKQVLVNGSGMTVYLFMPDATNTTSKVPAAIKANWPPVTASGTPSVASGLDQTKLAVEGQPDGTQQLSYNGHLLYTFVGDKAPGDANGQGLGGIWFVLSPAGDKIT